MVTFRSVWTCDAIAAAGLMKIWQLSAPNTANDITSIFKIKRKSEDLFDVRCVGMSAGSIDRAGKFLTEFGKLRAPDTDKPYPVIASKNFLAAGHQFGASPWDGVTESQILGNVFAILGQSPRRTYWSLFPVKLPERPNFHQPDAFRNLIGPSAGE